MKMIVTIAAAALATQPLAAHPPGEYLPVAPARASAAMGDGETAQAKAVKSSGTVTALDKPAGRITLDHQPIPEVRWSAKTMAFSAEPEVLRTVEVGDKVAFDATITGNAGEVIALSEQ